MPGARSGRTPTVTLAGEPRPLDGEALLGRLPDFALDALTRQLFDGAPRLGHYELPVDAVNARLVAYQLEELARCVRQDVAPEVDGALGLQAMAVPLAMLESGLAGQAVALDDVLALRCERYQAPINAALGIT